MAGQTIGYIRVSTTEQNEGRQKALKPEDVERLKSMLVEGNSKGNIAKKLGVTRQTVYSTLSERRPH